MLSSDFRLVSKTSSMHHSPTATCIMQAKGGSFGQGADRELYKFTINGKEAIPAVEEAVLGMKPGGIRRLIVPVELGYPGHDAFPKQGVPGLQE